MSLQMPALKKFVCRAYPSLSLSYNLIKLYVLLFLFPHCNVLFPPPHYTDIQRYAVTEFFCIPHKVFFFVFPCGSQLVRCRLSYWIRNLGIFTAVSVQEECTICTITQMNRPYHSGEEPLSPV